MAEENCVRSKELKDRESLHRKTMDPTVGRKLGKASKCPAVGVLWRPPVQQAMAELRPRRSISSVHRLSPSLTECSILVYELPGSSQFLVEKTRISIYHLNILILMYPSLMDTLKTLEVFPESNAMFSFLLGAMVQSESERNHTWCLVNIRTAFCKERKMAPTEENVII